jgi:hypothetical protein
MNIYQEVYDLITEYRHNWFCDQDSVFLRFGINKQNLSTQEYASYMWEYIGNKLRNYPNPQVIKVALEKYPILQQVIQMNESEVRS